MLNIDQLVFLKSRDRNKIKKTVIKIPSDIKYIRKVSSKVLEDLAPHDLKESDTFDIRLCIEEAVINAIVHGNRRDRKRLVRIIYWIKDDKLNVEVEDQGSGFDYTRLADPTANDNIMKGSGRGVYLIRNLMDEVEFGGAGNKIRMVKNLKR